MSVDTPLWLLLTASAFGGAALTGVITLATKLVDLRHRHDDARRDHYVVMLDALDEFQQALVVAVAANNDAADEVLAGNLAPGVNGVVARPVELTELGANAHQRLTESRRAVQVVYLFAPQAVAVLTRSLWRDMATIYGELQNANLAEKVDPPKFPATLWNELRDAIRKDLGVRRLDLVIDDNRADTT